MRKSERRTKGAQNICRVLQIATLVASLALSSLALAQEDDEEAAAPAAKAGAKTGGGKKGGGTKSTTLNFEDELIQGEANKPDLFYLLQRKQFNFKKLIKLREDFLPEMRRTSEELRRGGGKD